VPSDPDAAVPGATITLPLAAEVLRVGKRVVETGRVRVSVSTGTAEEIVRETLRTRRAVIERVTLGHEVREVPQNREEDGVLVIPVVEEILVVEKRLVLKEEIRLRFVDTEETVEQPVERRVQQATVERMPPGVAAAGNDPDAVPDAADPTIHDEETSP
jgi:stress response protein YsnF